MVFVELTLSSPTMVLDYAIVLVFLIYYFSGLDRAGAMGDRKAENAHHAGAGGSVRGTVSTPRARRAFHETCEENDGRTTEARIPRVSREVLGFIRKGS